MKATWMFIAPLLLCGGCVQQQKELTQAEKTQIKGEVKAVYDSVLMKFQKLECTGVLQYFSDAPEFVAYWPNGSTMDYQEFRKNMQWGDDSLASFSYTTTREEFPLVTSDAVIHVWIGNDTQVTKSGETFVYNPDVETHLFRKIDGRWKIALLHESLRRVMPEKGKKK